MPSAENSLPKSIFENKSSSAMSSRTWPSVLISGSFTGVLLFVQPSSSQWAEFCTGSKQCRGSIFSMVATQTGRCCSAISSISIGFSTGGLSMRHAWMLETCWQGTDATGVAAGSLVPRCMSCGLLRGAFTSDDFLVLRFLGPVLIFLTSSVTTRYDSTPFSST